MYNRTHVCPTPAMGVCWLYSVAWNPKLLAQSTQQVYPTRIIVLRRCRQCQVCVRPRRQNGDHVTVLIPSSLLRGIHAASQSGTPRRGALAGCSIVPLPHVQTGIVCEHSKALTTCFQTSISPSRLLARLTTLGALRSLASCPLASMGWQTSQEVAAAGRHQPRGIMPR